eukprot:432220_1
MLAVFILVLFGVITTESADCSVAAYDTTNPNCQCDPNDDSDTTCATLVAASTLSAFSPSYIDVLCVSMNNVGVCTANCDGITSPMPFTGAQICGQQASAFGLDTNAVTCEATDAGNVCVITTSTVPAPATTQTTSSTCTLEGADPTTVLDSVMGCTCVDDASNCVALQNEIAQDATLSGALNSMTPGETVACDSLTKYCSLSCTNGQPTCNTAATLVGNGVSFTCVNDVCTKGTVTTQAATTQAADTTDATDATDAATTQSATNSATDAATTQSATDAATTQSATDAATTQSATDAVTTLDCDSVVPVWSAPECGYNPLDGCGIRVDFTAYVCNLGKGLQKKKRIKTAIKLATLGLIGLFENNDVVCTEDMLVVGKPNEPFIQVKQLKGQQTVADAYALDGVETADGCPTVDELCDTDESLVFEIQARVELHCAVCADLFGLGRYLLSESEDIEFLENYDQFLADASAAQDDVCGVGFGTVNLQSPIYVAIVDENGEVLGDLERSVDLGSNAAYRSYVGAFVVVMGVLSFVY